MRYLACIIAGPILLAWVRDAAAAEGHVWELTPYLRGTADEIRDKLNREPARFIRRINETYDEIAQRKKAIEDERQKTIEAFRKSAPYIVLSADLKTAGAELEAARNGDDPQRRLDASSRYNNIRDELKRLEKEALLANRAIPEHEKRIAELDASIDDLWTGLKETLAWRAQLVDAILNSLAMRWPLVRGQRGVIKEITVLRVEPSGVVTATCRLPSVARHIETREHIDTVIVNMHEVLVSISGIDARGLSRGETVKLNASFEVEVADALSRVALLRRSPGNEDALIQAVLAPPGPLPATRASSPPPPDKPKPAPKPVPPSERPAPPARR